MAVLTPLPDLAAYRRRAARHLPRMVMDYVDGAAGEERGLDRNRAAFARTLFVPRRLTDVSRREAGVTLWGRDYPLPLAIAPMGLTGVLRPEGDLMLARAAMEPMFLGTPMDEVDWISAFSACRPDSRPAR